MKGAEYCGYCINQIGMHIWDVKNNKKKLSEIEPIVEALIMNYNKEFGNMTTEERRGYNWELKQALNPFPSEMRSNLIKLIGNTD